MDNLACSISDFLARMPYGGSHWLQHPQLPLQHLKVFSDDRFYFPEQPWVSIQEKVVDFLESLQESRLSDHLGKIDLVQFWAPTKTLRLSVLGQPFGVGSLSDGVRRYRYECMLRIQLPCRDEGDPISSAFASHSPRYQHHHYNHHQQYGIQSRWALPVVDMSARICHGVLEFVTVYKYYAEFHGLATQSFTDFGPVYYEPLLKDMMMGTNNGNGNFSFPTNSANEFQDLHFVSQLCNNPTGEQVQVLPQQIMGGTSSQIVEGAPSGTNLVNASEDPTFSPPAEENMGSKETPVSSRRRNKSTQNKETAKRGRPSGIQKVPQKKSNKIWNKYNMEMSVKAKYGTSIVLFKIDGTTGFEGLCKNVVSRFKLEADTFRIEYDEEESGDPIMITCDEDLKMHLYSLCSSNKETAIFKVTKHN